MDKNDFNQANALALHFIKEPLRVTSSDDEPVCVEVAGLYITEDISKPLVCKTLRGYNVSHTLFEWTILGVHVQDNGHWDPPSSDEFEIDKAYSLTKAIEKIILFLKEEEIKNFSESYYWENRKEESKDEDF